MSSSALTKARLRTLAEPTVACQLMADAANRVIWVYTVLDVCPESLRVGSKIGSMPKLKGFGLNSSPAPVDFFDYRAQATDSSEAWCSIWLRYKSITGKHRS